jgi:hypothetical protein
MTYPTWATSITTTLGTITINAVNYVFTLTNPGSLFVKIKKITVSSTGGVAGNVIVRLFKVDTIVGGFVLTPTGTNLNRPAATATPLFNLTSAIVLSDSLSDIVYSPGSTHVLLAGNILYQEQHNTQPLTLPPGLTGTGFSVAFVLAVAATTTPRVTVSAIFTEEPIS